MDAQYILKNKEGWDLRTGVHLKSKFYDVSRFIKGENTLNKPELELIQNVENKTLLHLQCHFGLDTLSWGRLGAIPTGVDFSSNAIKAARTLSKEAGIAADFIEADVQDLKPHINKESFDLVFSSYGVLCWVENLEKWAEGIYFSLKSGGKFVLVEFHPILDILFDGIVSGFSQYFNSKKPLGEVTRGTYTDREADIEYLEYRWQHPLSEVINVLLKVGLKLDTYQEYPYSPYKLFPSLVVQENGCWFSKDKKQDIPYLYSLMVTKDGN
jgi:SAM-dependent methyltransferase